jgi:glycosyltransferase involved in cell wall biosynthesis
VAIDKPELLYLTPVVPALTGNGLAMRAGMVLEALAAHYRISALVVRLYPPFRDALPEPLACLCRRALVVPPPHRGERRPWWTLWKPDPFRSACDNFRRFDFDTVHVFRMAMLPFAGRFLNRPRPGRRHLDLDDIESLTHARIASLCRVNGDGEIAAFEAAMAERSQHCELQACQDFDRVYVCSAEDRSRLLERAPRAEICVLPNGVRLPAEQPAPDPKAGFSFLFVGTLGYYPNEDAVRYLAAEIVPRIRQKARGPFSVRIVGTGASARLREAVARVGLVMDGEVPDMLPLYGRTAAVVVPVRAGGGTRIKILEAWSCRCPVVTTSAGVEGIAARHEEHVLIGDTPNEFAAQCLRLMIEPDLAPRLVAKAHLLLLSCYTAEVIERTIAALEACRAH